MPQWETVQIPKQKPKAWKDIRNAYLCFLLLSSLFLFVENCQFGVQLTLCYIRNNAKLTSPFRRQISEFSIYLYHLTTIFYTVILHKVFAQVLYIVAKYSFKENRKIYFLFQGHSLAFLCRRYSPVPRRFLCLFPFPGSQMFRSLQKRVISPLSASGSFPHISQIGYLHEFDLVYNFFVCCGDRQTLFG